jgi:ADP-ribose pyrophosphatase YjhB (NUDIX family)
VNDPGKDLWWIPGGRIRFHERLDDAARRELREETGLKAVKIEKKGVMEHIWPEVHFITTFFLAEVNSMNVVMNDEHLEYAWISSLDESLHKYVKYMIKESNIFQSE